LIQGGTGEGWRAAGRKLHSGGPLKTKAYIYGARKKVWRLELTLETRKIESSSSAITDQVLEQQNSPNCALMVNGTDADDMIDRMRIVHYISMQSEGRGGLTFDGLEIFDVTSG